LAAFAALFVVTLGWPGTGQAQAFTVAKYNIGGEGGTDYIVAEPGTGRVFVSRGSHVMVVEGATGTVIGDIPDTPRMHGVGLAPKWNHGFTTNAGDSTVTMFNLKTLAVIKKIPTHTGGLDGMVTVVRLDGPAPAPAPGSPPPVPGSRPLRGPVVAAWFFAIRH
jgi:hypothetical protein